VVPVRAARGGVVTAVGMRAGSFVNPMQEILAYADNRRVWAEITLYPDQLTWLKNGDEIVLRSSLDKAVTQRARVNLAALQIDPQTRTAKLRLPLTNLRNAFPSGAFAEADIAARGQRTLSVPRDAVIRTGHGDFVVVAGDADHFRSVRVRTGIETDEAVAILEGLQAGDRVVVNGQFLLDGAASMQALQARLLTQAQGSAHK
jgi:Cu(I)/Ag(I) efflux system membrane fusion protein